MNVFSLLSLCLGGKKCIGFGNDGGGSPITLIAANPAEPSAELTHVSPINDSDVANFAIKQKGVLSHPFCIGLIAGD